MKQKTTVQLFDEAFAKMGSKRLHIEPAALPSAPKARKPRKHGDNGSKK